MARKKTVPGTDIEYELVRSTRKTLGITVYPDLRVTVRAPQKVGMADIENMLQDRSDWIRKQLKRFAANHPPLEITYSSGETHHFLGKPYQLQVVVAKRNRIELDGEYMILYVTDASDIDLRENTVKKWYRKQAKIIFEERLQAVYHRVEPLGIPYPEIRVKDMKTRWGSCSGMAKRVNLNLRLMQVPVAHVDYVIIHELCHFIQRNHSKAYYDLLASVLPEWKRLRKELNRFRVV
ncbi:MAG: M48 family metallopeptidase [Chloroflexi bacterium]|nr:M48 family metallopeptidase [Chloroflexota bacterium]